MNFAILIVMFYALFRVHRFNSYQINKDTLMSLFFIELFALVLELFVYYSLDIKDDENFTTVLALPPIVGTFIFFMGNFIRNDFHFFTKDHDTIIIAKGQVASKSDKKEI